MAEKLIAENQQLNKEELAKLVADYKPKDQRSETPMMDAVRHSRAVMQGDTKTAAALVEKINYGTTTAGGYFAPDENATFFLDLVNRDSNVLQYCRKIPMKSNTMTIPTLTAAGNAYTVAEASSANSAALTAVNTTTSYVQMTAYKHGVYQIATAELFDDSDPAFETILRDAMVREMASYIDWGIFHGNNTAGYDTSGSLLKGLEGNDVITSNVTNAGGTPSYDDILKLKVPQDNTKGELMIFMAPAAERALAGVKDNSGRYIYDPSVRSANVPMIWGMPVVLNNRISKTLGGGSETAIFSGAFKDSALIGIKPEVRFIVDWTTYAESTSVKLTVSTRVAFEVANENHFAMVNGITV